MNWIMENKTWLFSGVAIAIPLAIIGWLLARSSKKINQKQKSGSGSINVQTGGDININRKEKDDEQ